MVKNTSCQLCEFLQGSPKAGVLLSSQIGQALLESSKPGVLSLSLGRWSAEGVRVTQPLVSPHQSLLKQNGLSSRIC